MFDLLSQADQFIFLCDNTLCMNKPELRKTNWNNKINDYKQHQLGKI